MKKFILLIILLSSLMHIHAYEINYLGGIYQTTSEAERTAILVSHENTPGYVSVPATVSLGNTDYFVVGINNYAFQDCDLITVLDIGPNVSTIGNYALSGCTGLRNLTLPNSVTSIGWKAFYDCSGLETISFGSSIMSIGHSAFENCVNIKEIRIPGTKLSAIEKGVFENCIELTNVVLPESIKTIGDSAFKGCHQLTNITIPRYVTSIGNSAFEDCTSLSADLIIPSFVTSIGTKAFSGCGRITSIEIGNSIVSIGDYAFKDCNNVTTVGFFADNCISCGSFNNEVFPSSIYRIIIGENVKTIPNYAFQNCTNLVGVNIPNSVVSIGESAFYGCTGLVSLTMGSSVESIGNFSFYGCSGIIGNLTIPNTVKSIGNYSFNGCKGITSINFGSSVNFIGNSAFNECSGISGDLTLPNSVTWIGSSAFKGCSGITGNLRIPDMVETVGNNAFNGCRLLTSVEIGSSLCALGESAFMGCDNLSTVIYNAVNCSLNGAVFPSSITNLSIGNNVKTIPNYAFSGCERLSAVTIPASVMEVGKDAFLNCQSLSKVEITDLDSWCKINFNNWSSNPLYYAHHLFLDGTEILELIIPSSVISIGNNAFYGGEFSSIKIPISVLEIGENAFMNCTRLKKVEISNLESWCNIDFFNKFSNPLFLSNHLYIGNTEVITVNIPPSITSIKDYAFAGGKYITTLELNDPVTSIGEESYFDCGIENLFIPSSISKVGPNAFSGCPIENLTINCPHISNWFNNCTTLKNLTIDSAVQSIADNAFTGCDNLYSLIINSENWNVRGDVFYPSVVKLTIGDKVKNISESAFENFKKLQNVKLGVSIISIPKSIFRNCLILTSIEIPNNIVTIGDYAFYGCEALQKIELPKNLTEIGQYAFGNCSSLTDITIPNCISSLQNSTFRGCSNLSNVNISDSVNSIGESVFNGCGALEAMIIPNSVTFIGKDAFNGCGGMKNIILGNSIQEIGEAAFKDCNGLLKVEISDLESWCKINFINVFSNPLYLAHHLYVQGDEIVYLKIPDLITRIKDYAFVGGIGFTSIEIGRGVTSIGNSVFYGCDQVNEVIFNAENCIVCGSENSMPVFPSSVNSLIIGENVRCIPDWGFRDLFNITHLTIPDSVQEIGKEAFSGWSKLIDLQIGKGIISIGDYAFLNCKLLPNIKIPSSIVSIGRNAFYGCTNLNRVEVTDLKSWCNIDFANEDSNPVKYAHNLYINDQEIKNLVIPQEITTIKNYTFLGCESLTNIEITGNVKEIGAGAFSYCNKIIDIDFGPSVQKIGNNAFSSCTGLIELFIPNSVISIGDGAFKDCSGLNLVAIGKGITSLGDYAFSGALPATMYITSSLAPNITNTTFLTDSNNPDMHNLYVSPSTYEDIRFLSKWRDSFKIKVDYGPSRLIVYVDGYRQQTTGGQTGAERQLSTVLIPWYSDQEVPLLEKVFFYSSDPSCASVSKGGLLTMKDGNKNCILTCETMYDIDPVIIEVQGFGDPNPIPVDNIVLDKDQIFLIKDQRYKLTATVYPEDASYSGITWSSSEESIALVSDEGEVLGVSEGTARITAAIGNIQAHCTVTVIKPEIPVESISLNKESVELCVGETETLVATVHPEDAPYSDITWSSSDTTVALVSDEGKVLAVSEGTARITAAIGDIKATCVVTVIKPEIPVESISLNKESVELCVGDTETLVATVYPQEATVKELNWSSEDECIAHVSTNGVVYAMAAGETNITVSCGEVSVSCRVIVTELEKPVERIPVEVYEDFAVGNIGLPLGSANKPSTPQKYTSSQTGIGYNIMGCYINNYENPTYLLINGKNNAGAFLAFSLDFICTEIRLLTSNSCSTNSNSAVNVYADNNLIGKFVVNSQNKEFNIEIPESYRKEGTVYKVESATTSYNQQFSGFTYIGYELQEGSGDQEVKPKAIFLNETSVTLETGLSYQLTATVFPANANEKGVVWHSSSNAVASVNETGLVVANGEGECVIRATSLVSSDVYAECCIKVINPVIPPSESQDWSIAFDNTLTKWSNVYCYVWDGGTNYQECLGPWPGEKMQLGSFNGQEAYIISFSTTPLEDPMVIFHSGTGTQTDDLELVNNTLYDFYGKKEPPTSGIYFSEDTLSFKIENRELVVDSTMQTVLHVIRMDGVVFSYKINPGINKVATLEPGIYIIGGKKVVVK